MFADTEDPSIAHTRHTSLSPFLLHTRLSRVSSRPPLALCSERCSALHHTQAGADSSPTNDETPLSLNERVSEGKGGPPGPNLKSKRTGADDCDIQARLQKRKREDVIHQSHHPDQNPALDTTEEQVNEHKPHPPSASSGNGHGPLKCTPIRIHRRHTLYAYPHG